MRSMQASLMPRITSRLSPSKIVRLGTLQTPACALVVAMMFSLRRERSYAEQSDNPLRIPINQHQIPIIPFQTTHRITAPVNSDRAYPR